MEDRKTVDQSSQTFDFSSLGFDQETLSRAELYVKKVVSTLLVAKLEPGLQARNGQVTQQKSEYQLLGATDLARITGFTPAAEVINGVNGTDAVKDESMMRIFNTPLFEGTQYVGNRTGGILTLFGNQQKSGIDNRNSDGYHDFSVSAVLPIADAKQFFLDAQSNPDLIWAFFIKLFPGLFQDKPNGKGINPIKSDKINMVGMNAGEQLFKLTRGSKDYKKIEQVLMQYQKQLKHPVGFAPQRLVKSR